MKVRININELCKYKNDIEFLIEELKPYINDSIKIIDNMHSIWSGSDANMFHDKVNILIYELQQVEKSLQTYLKFLNGYIIIEERIEEIANTEEIEII